MELAGFMLRACALVLDMIIAASVIAASGFMFGNGSAGVIAVAILMLLVYPLLMPLTNWKGTLGKKIIGLQIVRDETHEKISLPQAIVRYMIAWVHVFSRLIYLTAAFTKKKQTVHDMAAKTIVLKAE
ncbi:RDD family protein [Bacillus halotolerans]|uniref:RDD family protein n=1 Tax=Bacillus halotolerans TaxID=260554 RepID=UPI0022301D28|nr:RDD family protein [Bacillus halotolerans]UZD53370.1 RDD family protein [Bacillus halotolerans]